MIWGIPKGPFWLGLAGLLPFLWGTFSMWFLIPGEAPFAWLPSRLFGPYVSIFYGTVILSFMSGVLWGFATRSRYTRLYVLSVIPALWGFLMIGNGPVWAAISLMIGFWGVLVLDYVFWQQNLTPEWWMRLRGILTVIVFLCLLTIVI
ncbi:MAG: DUF3429 domain-containing protein [Paracoccaceae bacterium]